MTDTALEKSIRARAEAWRAERRDLRRSTRWETAALVLMLVPFALALGWGALAFRQFGQLQTRQPVDVPFLVSPTVATELYHLATGRVSPETALQVALAAMALCATINVALAIDNATTGRRDLVADSEWRSSLRGAVWIVCMGTLVVTLAAWANINSPEKIGHASAATLFTIVTMTLTRSVRRQTNRADRDGQLDTACTKLERLESWKEELTNQHVPPQESHPSSVWRYLWACAWRLLVVSVAGVLLFAVTLMIGFLLCGEMGEFMRNQKLWVLPLVGMQLCSTLVLGSFIVFYSVLRRWTAYDCKSQRRRRWRLEILPRIAGGGYLLFATLAVPLAWFGTGWIAAVFTASLLLPGPMIVEAVLWASRRWPDQPWIRIAAQPVWGLTHLSLEHDRANHESVKDRVLNHERAEIADLARQAAYTQQAGGLFYRLLLDGDGIGPWANGHDVARSRDVILVDSRANAFPRNSLAIPLDVPIIGRRPH